MSVHASRRYAIIAMNIEIKPELERRLQTIAQDRSQTLSELVEEAMVYYLDALEGESSSWVATTQGLLPGAWSREDFSEWSPDPDLESKIANPGYSRQG
jgi:hypothetical protein